MGIVGIPLSPGLDQSIFRLGPDIGMPQPQGQQGDTRRTVVDGWERNPNKYYFISFYFKYYPFFE